MDTSKIYIKMCDCPEIQDDWKLKQGDFASFPLTGVISVKHINEDDKYYLPKKAKAIKENNIWLPRQDQIQEMIYPHQDGVAYLTVELSYWLQKPREFQPKSMEQLWLAFYMHEKHSKIWDKNKWVKK